MGLQEPDMFVQVNWIYSARAAKGLLKSCQLCVCTIKHTWRQQQTERSQRASKMSQKSRLAEHLTTSHSSGAEWLIFRSSNHFPVLIELLRKMAAAQSRESPTVSQAQEALVFGMCGDQTKIDAKFQLHSRKLLDACNASSGGKEILDPKNDPPET